MTDTPTPAPRDDVAEAVVHVREYAADDSAALEYWARMLAAEVGRLRAVADAVLAVAVELDELQGQAERDCNSPKLMGYELHEAQGEASAYAHAEKLIRRALEVTG